MTPEQLAVIRARAEAAQPGPWRAAPCGDDDGVIWIETVEDGGYPVCGMDEDRPADAQFIASAREDIPALLAEVARLRTALVTTRYDAALVEMQARAVAGDPLGAHNRQLLCQELESLVAAFGFAPRLANAMLDAWQDAEAEIARLQAAKAALWEVVDGLEIWGGEPLIQDQPQYDAVMRKREALHRVAAWEREREAGDDA